MLSQRTLKMKTPTPKKTKTRIHDSLLSEKKANKKKSSKILVKLKSGPT